MNDRWIDRLSEYVDGVLPPEEQTALEAHLAGCRACADTLAELRRVVARARSLEDRPPATDLWPKIAARIGVARGAAGSVVPLEQRRLTRWERRRLSLSVPQLIAAGIVLMLASAGTALLVGPRGPTARLPEGTSAARPSATGVSVAGWPAATPRYDAAVAELEAALAQGRGRLDTATVRVIEQSLLTIDRAIVRARAALAADPANAYLNRHLAETMRRKLELLRRANALAAAQS